MDFEQFKNLPVFRESDLALDFYALDDQRDRTLLYGYSTHAIYGNVTHHVYLQDSKIHVLIYSHLEHVVFHRVCYEANVSYVIPNRRLYPEHCDEDACCQLIGKGVSLPFTTFDQSSSERPFQGKQLEQLRQPEPHILTLWALKETLVSDVRAITLNDCRVSDDDNQETEAFINKAYQAMLSVYLHTTTGEPVLESAGETFFEMSKDLHSLYYGSPTLARIENDLEAFRNAAAIIGVTLPKYTPED
jgi:hypothetical protein